jgi:hypothetical protein
MSNPKVELHIAGYGVITLELEIIQDHGGCRR